jgi:type II secretory pathway pseudopilin PulG
VKHGRTAGITLVEMMMVVAIIAMVGGLVFPAVTSGLDSVRLSSASDSIVSFLNAGLTRADRRQTPVEILISVQENKIKILAVDLSRELQMPESIRIVKILPELPSDEEQARSIVLYPNGAIPRFGVEITSPKGIHRIVRVDPITGVPQVEIPQP